MPGERATGGVFLWLPFFAQAKKVTRSHAGQVEALHFKRKIKMDSRFLGNDVKRKELDSGFRRNDEQERSRNDEQKSEVRAEATPSAKRERYSATARDCIPR
jgi:hypothetical protein